MNLRELSTADVDKIRDAVTALTVDLRYLDLIRACRENPNTGERYAELERQTAAYVEKSARALAAVLA